MKANLRIVVALACAVLVGSSFAQGQGRRGGQRGGGNTLSALVRRPDVQAELKLTDEEKTKIEAIPRPARPAQGTPPPDQATMRARMEEQNKAVEAILTPDQTKRLHELLIQRMGPQAIQNEEVQAGLGLSDDQKAKVKSLQDKFQQAGRDLREKQQSGDMDRQAVGAAMQANQKTLNEELAKVITPDQQTKLTAMGGAPFKFEAPAGGGGGRRGGN